MLGELGQPQPYEVTWAPTEELPQLTNFQGSPGNFSILSEIGAGRYNLGPGFTLTATFEMNQIRFWQEVVSKPPGL